MITLKRSTAMLLSAVMLVLLIGSFFLGRSTAAVHEEHSSQTFYATVEQIDGENFTVNGLPVNDINFRGSFSFKIGEKTELIWRYTDITLSDIQVGDKISVTFYGEIMESHPAQIKDVRRIILLDDEK